jgi:hypothetical protein
MRGHWNPDGAKLVYCSFDPATTIPESAAHGGSHVMDIQPFMLTGMRVGNPADARSSAGRTLRTRLGFRRVSRPQLGKPGVRGCSTPIRPSPTRTRYPIPAGTSPCGLSGRPASTRSWAETGGCWTPGSIRHCLEARRRRAMVVSMRRAPWPRASTRTGDVRWARARSARLLRASAGARNGPTTADRLPGSDLARIRGGWFGVEPRR